MRLDPKRVKFLAPVLQIGNRWLRFVGRENNIQLAETALTVEGNVLKVGLLGIERLFRRALSEWTTVTIPYSRMTRARLVRWPVVRVAGALLALAAGVFTVLGIAAFAAGDPAAGGRLFGLAVVLGPIGVVVLAAVRPRYVIHFRRKDGRRRAVQFRVTDTRLARAFDDRLQQYRRAAAGHGAGGRA